MTFLDPFDGRPVIQTGMVAHLIVEVDPSLNHLLQRGHRPSLQNQRMAFGLEAAEETFHVRDISSPYLPP